MWYVFQTIQEKMPSKNGFNENLLITKCVHQKYNYKISWYLTKVTLIVHVWSCSRLPLVHWINILLFHWIRYGVEKHEMVFFFHHIKFKNIRSSELCFQNEYKKIYNDSDLWFIIQKTLKCIFSRWGKIAHGWHTQKL